MPIPQRTDVVVLFQNDDQHEIDRLRQAIETAATSSKMPLRLGDDENVVAAARAYDEKVAESTSRGTPVDIKALPGREWRRLVAAHPPREKNADDEEWGWNVATFPDVVVPLCVTAIDGEAMTGEALQEAIDSLNDGDFTSIYFGVRRLNTGRGPDPTVSILEMLRRTSPEISESPDRLG